MFVCWYLSPANKKACNQSSIQLPQCLGQGDHQDDSKGSLHAFQEDLFVCWYLSCKPELGASPFYTSHVSNKESPKMVEEQACMLTRYPMQHGSKMPMQITKSPKQDKKQDLYIYPKLTDYFPNITPAPLSKTILCPCCTFSWPIVSEKSRKSPDSM